MKRGSMNSLITLEKLEELERIDRMLLDQLVLEEVEEDLENQEQKVKAKQVWQ